MQLEDAFNDVESLAAEFLKGRTDEKRALLQRIFRLNAEIGRLARRNPTLAKPLRELQVHVNFMTVAVKHDNARQLGEALEQARNSVLGLAQKT